MQYYKIPKEVLDQYLVEEETDQKYTVYSQRDPRWKDIKLGFGPTTIGSHGCFLTSLAMMKGITPDKVNEILKQNGGFNGDLIVSSKAAEALGLEYHGIEDDIDKEPGWFPNIKEVDMSPAPGKQQHFVLRIFEDGRKYIIDPWTGKKEHIGFYPFVSYRLFK